MKLSSAKTNTENKSKPVSPFEKKNQSKSATEEYHNHQQRHQHHHALDRVKKGVGKAVAASKKRWSEISRYKPPEHKHNQLGKQSQKKSKRKTYPTSDNE